MFRVLSAFEQLCKAVDKNDLRGVKLVLGKASPGQRTALLRQQYKFLVSWSLLSTQAHRLMRAQYCNSTALHTAAVKGYTSIASYLITMGAKVNIRNPVSRMGSSGCWDAVIAGDGRGGACRLATWLRVLHLLGTKGTRVLLINVIVHRPALLVVVTVVEGKCVIAQLW